MRVADPKKVLPGKWAPISISYRTSKIELEVETGDFEPFWMNYWIDGETDRDPDRQYFFGRLKGGDMFVIVRGPFGALKPVFADAMEDFTRFCEEEDRKAETTAEK